MSKVLFIVNRAPLDAIPVCRDFRRDPLPWQRHTKASRKKRGKGRRTR